MIFDAVEEHFEAGAVVQIFARMNFEAEVDADFVEFIEDGSPAFGEFVEGSFDKAGGTLRPGIHIGPGERTGKCDVGAEAEIPGGFGSVIKLVDGPFMARFGIVADIRRGESIERGVVGRMDSDKLALQVCGEFGDRETVLFRDAGDFVPIGFALAGGFEIEEAGVPSGNLHAFVAKLCGPGADGIATIEGRGVTGELGEEDCGSFYRFHSWSAPAFSFSDRNFVYPVVNSTPTRIDGEILG